MEPMAQIPKILMQAVALQEYFRAAKSMSVYSQSLYFIYIHQKYQNKLQNNQKCIFLNPNRGN